MHSNAYTFRFAAMVTIVCSVLLAGAATILKPRQVENEKLDIKKNILSSVGIKPADGQVFSRLQIADLYKKNIKEVVLDKNGDIVEGKIPSDLDPKKDTELFPFYQRINEGNVEAYIIPISGKGLWSTIYGYIALQTDGATVRGITFYKHGETPGLGGEIEKDWFIGNYVGKKIRTESGELKSIDIIKGKVSEKYSGAEADFYVDGVSGATLTCRGVNAFLRADLKKYEPFFKKLLDKEGGV